MREEGDRGEQIALQHLLQKGYRLLRSNYISPYGEIDLIMYNDQYLVFVEVRMRANRDFGHPLETVTRTKQQRIRKTAQHYLMRNPKTTLQPRIDVVSIDAPGGGFKRVAVEHIENAFFM